MPVSWKKILIIDETGFSRICSAILELEGYKTEIITDTDIANLSHIHTYNLSLRLNKNEFGLIITSYPYGFPLCKEIKSKKVPTIILFDSISKDFINILESFDNSYCMIKPLDYMKFRLLVNQVMSGELNTNGGYNIV